MVAGFFTAFDPELKITVREGKVFDPLESRVQQVRALPEIDIWTETLEETQWCSTRIARQWRLSKAWRITSSN